LTQKPIWKEALSLSKEKSCDKKIFRFMLAVFVDFALDGDGSGRICAKRAVDGCDPKDCVAGGTNLIHHFAAEPLEATEERQRGSCQLTPIQESAHEYSPCSSCHHRQLRGV
jgi:hypothetical protein